MNQIDEAVAAAENAAANTTPAVQEQTNGALAPAQSGAVDMSLTSFLKAGGINPDKWVSVKDTGIKLDKQEKALIQDFTGEIDFANVKMFQGLRIALPGNKYEYIKTYDGRTESKTGMAWGAAVQEANARAISPSTPYRGADILITLDKDVKQGGTTIPAGTKVGYTTSITGFAPFQSFLQTLVTEGKIEVQAGDVLSGVVPTKVVHETKSNADYEWGILTFEAV